MTGPVPGELVRASRPLRPDLVRRELESFCHGFAARDAPGEPSLCAGWSIADVGAHLATTVERFVVLLRRARLGDFSLPFKRSELDAHNEQLVREFAGDPVGRLREAVVELLAMAHDPAELTAHLYGPISMGLQMQIALFELAVHHHDISPPERPYSPSRETVETLAVLCREVLHPVSFPQRRWRSDVDDWSAVLSLSGRPTI